jgi:flagellar basal body-associated protein FliL
MKSHKILQIVALILMIIGLIGLTWSFQPSEGTTVADLPSGAGYYNYIEVSMWFNGHMAGDFTVTSGDGTVRIFILDSTQYSDYSHDGQVSESIFAYIASTGTFSVDLPTTSTYYLVVDHGSTTTAKIVEISYEVSGLDLKYLIGGAVLLAVGAVLAIIGMRMKAKSKATETQPPQASPNGEVVMFDKKT